MDIPPIQPDSKTMDDGIVLVVVRAFFHHYRLFVYTMLFSFSIIMGMTLVMKKQYRSEMKYLVQNSRSTPVLSSDRTSTSVVNEVTEEQLNSELGILQSEDVLSAVADPDWKPSEAGNKSRQEVWAHAKKITRLTDNLTVDPIGKEDIMTVSYLADSPWKANHGLAALSAAYLARHERLRRPTGASSFFVEQASLYERVWRDATQKLIDFEQMHRLVSVADVETSLQRSIIAGEEQLREIDLKLHESEASIRQANGILATVPSRQQTQQRLVPSEMLLQQLKTSLASMTNRRTELLNRYPPTDRMVVEIDRQIADTKSMIASESAMDNVENTSDVNPSWQDLKTSLVREQVNHRVLEVGRATLSAQLNQLRSQLTETQGLALAFEDLHTRADEAQSNYKAFVEKRDAAYAEDSMDANKLLNVTIMETPTFPYAAARPKPLLNLALGLPTALFLAIAAVYVAETGRATINTPKELDALGEYPVLATIPWFTPMAGSRHSATDGLKTPAH